MTSSNGDDGSTEDSGTDPADAFAALSDPLRVDVLRALAAHNREVGHDEAIGFADLRRRVDVRDSGRFRYHLNELRGRFVQRTDDGYRLTHVGQEVVTSILAGTYTDALSRGPAELDSDCPGCDAAVVAAYEDGLCRVACESGHLLFVWRLPPAAAADADLPAVVERAELLARQAIERVQTGLCPYCYGEVDPAVEVEAASFFDAGEGADSAATATAEADVSDAEATEVGATDADATPADRDTAAAVRFRTTCDTCGVWVDAPVGFRLLVDPEVAAFHRERGRPLRNRHLWEPAFVREDAAVSIVDEDPVRVEVTAGVGDDSLSVTVDERGRVVSVAADRDGN